MLDREAKARVAEQEARVSSFVNSLRLFLERNVSRILSDLDTGTLTAREAAKALGGLESALKDEGLDERFAKVRELFKDQFDSVAAEFQDTTGKAALLSDFTKRNLSTFVNERLEMAATYVQDYIGDVRNVVLDAVIAGKKIKPSEILPQAEGKTLANLETEINTTLMAYQRVLHLEKAKKSGVDKFLYVGPLDSINRPFCKKLVGKIITREEIARLDNEQGLPVSIYCGGYNCRHHWRPVSDELAKELG